MLRRALVASMWRLRSSSGAASIVGISGPVPRIAGRCRPQLPPSAVQHPWCLFSSSARPARLQARAASSSSAEPEAPPDVRSRVPQPPSERLLQLLRMRLPSYCTGCGIKLQQEDPDGPGYFQVPRRLIELAGEQAMVLQEDAGAAAEQQQLSAEERERRSIDRAMEEWLDEQQRPAVPLMDAGEDGPPPEAAISCARCFSLVHHGKVKSLAAEALLPSFDLAAKVGRKMALQRDRGATVLLVVDVWDFDGSLPRGALAELLPAAGAAAGPAAEQAALPFKLAVAVNKFDLLPSQATAKRVEQWVRGRLRQAGLPRPDAVYMVSAKNGLGVKELVGGVKNLLGFRADLWVVGAQNAGKSSLIAAMKRLGGTAGVGDPTIAALPGTTLGLLRVPGLPLGPKHRAFDTPGVHHSYQLTSLLTHAELAAVLPRRRLKPRTYRLPPGACLLLGGLARLDVISAPSATIYVTLFISDEVVTHCGKVEGAEERRQRHVGGLLAPPFEPARLADLPLVARDAVVEGSSWRQHSRDIAIAGLGWVAVGCDGTAELRVWVPHGVSVTMHDALIPDYAREFQRPGFSQLLPSSASGGGARGGEQQQLLVSSSGASGAQAAAGAGSGGGSSSSRRSSRGGSRGSQGRSSSRSGSSRGGGRGGGRSSSRGGGGGR